MSLAVMMSSVRRQIISCCHIIWYVG